MSSAEEDDRVAELLERLLLDEAFRAEFRRNPAAACESAGLDALAAELRSGNSLLRLEAQESKSSLAGVVMAFAAEGVGFAELEGLVGRGLHGQAHAAAMQALRTARVDVPGGGGLPGRAVSLGQVAPPGGEARHVSASMGDTTANPPSGAGSSSAPPGGSSASDASTSGASTSGGAASHAAASVPASGATSSNADPTAAAAPSAGHGVMDGAQSGDGAATGAANHAGADGSASATLAQVLSSPRLSLPEPLRAAFMRGDADSRLVSLLGSALAHHTIKLADMEIATEPVHAQAIDIVAVDGQPVGPANVELAI